MRHLAKFRAGRSNRCRDIAVIRFFKMSNLDLFYGRLKSPSESS